jgi:tRNA pseudouridine55 synthase
VNVNVDKTAKTLSGVLVIDKPRGPTSHDVVARLRKKLGTREIGHSGTLDPMATGVLVVALGQATKLTPYLTMADKSYEATLAFGVETDTLDAEGRPTVQREVPKTTLDALERIRKGEVPLELVSALALEQARTSQIPPAYSAIKKGGEAAHVRARRGEDPELEARPVVVHAIKLLDVGIDPAPWLAIAIRVSKGYYVRSLARDIARGLGTVGHLTALRRTASGKFTLDLALPLDTPGDELEARILPLERAAQHALPELSLSHEAAREASYGRPVPLDGIEDVGWGPHAWFDPEGRLIAIGERDAEGLGRVLRGFHPEHDVRSK